MSHELSIQADGTVEAAFAGKVPWHGLGQMVDEHMSVNEALDAAHLRWKVAVEDLLLWRRTQCYHDTCARQKSRDPNG